MIYVKLIFHGFTESITLEQCLECQKVQLDIYVDEGCTITVENSGEIEKIQK